MADPFLGEIRVFPFNYAPVGWALCNGQLLPISQNTALFSILGTTYGGNGTSNFALPNLQGCIPLGQGQGPGLSPYQLGAHGGAATVTLAQPQMAAHTHSLNVDKEMSTSASPAGAALMLGHYTSSSGSTGRVAVYNTTAPNTQLNTGAIGSAGGGQPHNNMMPYVAMTFCIATQGIYPQRP